MSLLKLNNKLLKLNNKFEVLTFTPAPSIMDYDGNIYTSVTIGTQTWLTTNLKTTHYTDGTIIPNLTGNTDWSADSTGAYCWYSNNEGTYKNLYGGLYNWLAATNAHELAPTGWKIPSLSDYQTLGTYLGGASVAGGYLKETGTTHWNSPNNGTNDSAGFTALPGGTRMSVGTFGLVKSYAFLWTTDIIDLSNSYCMTMINNNISLSSSTTPWRYGGSIRCIKI